MSWESSSKSVLRRSVVPRPVPSAEEADLTTNLDPAESHFSWQKRSFVVKPDFQLWQIWNWKHELNKKVQQDMIRYVPFCLQSWVSFLLHVASPRMLTNCETGEEPAEASLQITNIEYVTYICHLYLASLISLITTVIIVIRIIDKCMYDIWYTYCKIYYMIFINIYINIFIWIHRRISTFFLAQNWDSSWFCQLRSGTRIHSQLLRPCCHLGSLMMRCICASAPFLTDLHWDPLDPSWNVSTWRLWCSKFTARPTEVMQYAKVNEKPSCQLTWKLRSNSANIFNKIRFTRREVFSVGLSDLRSCKNQAATKDIGSAESSPWRKQDQLGRHRQKLNLLEVPLFEISFGWARQVRVLTTIPMVL